jgi:intergrase/recombinase
LLNEYKKSINLINSRDINVKIIIRLFNYLKDEGVPKNIIVFYRNMLRKCNKSRADNFVPTDEEVKQTLFKLRPDLVPLYLLFLFSGIRIAEGKYLLNSISKLKI